MPIIAGFDQLASVPEERITDKISGKQGTRSGAPRTSGL